MEATSNHTINTGRKLVGKVAIVTDDASGIGKATAHLLSNPDVHMVVIVDIYDHLGDQVVASVDLDKCSYMHCNVANEEQVKHLLESTVSIYRQVDIMISNVGIMSRFDQTILDLNFSEFKSSK